ncbi:hypothetical protein HK096_005719, partial [Nowakowskiella sp. JEL0078]
MVKRTFSLKRERHLELAPADGRHFPTEMRRCVRLLELAKVNKNAVDAANASAELAELNEEVADWEKVVHFAKEELKWAMKITGLASLTAQARANSNLAKGYRGLCSWDLALEHLENCRRLAESTKNTVGLKDVILFITQEFQFTVRIDT